jgi:Fe-S oxidoreductase
MMLELRTRLIKDGKKLPEHQKYIDSLRKENNMRLESGAGRGKWAEGLNVKKMDKESAQVLFHAGCRFSFDKDLQEAARAAVAVLKDAGVDIGIMGSEEMCCGARAYQMGFREDFAAYAKKVVKNYQRLGVKTIVTSCANCYHAFLRLYPGLDAHFEVLHTVQYIDRLIKEGKIKFKGKIPLRVTYHDPCHLGRQGEPYVPWDGKEIKIRNQIVAYDPPRPRNNGAKGVYDAPRDVLRSIPGIELVEMERVREYAWCCGAGGGVKEAYPDFSGWTAAERIEEAKATGAEAIVSACGTCERNFIDAASASGEKIKVFDIAQIVRRAMAEGGV